MKYRTQPTSGFSFVEVIIVTALVVLVFGALFASFQIVLRLINNSQAKLSALSLATDRMEYFRSLPYNDVGTIAGIPAGTIPQNSTTTLNNILFYERVLVEYVDDPADGLNINDNNGIPSDYKRVKLEYSWRLAGASSTIALVSNIVPRSMETTAGGGTIRINVINDQSALLPGASVQLINNTIVPAIDVTRDTDASGAALFSGSPAGSDYEVIVTANIAGNDYSTDQTHQVSVANPVPDVAPFSVLESDISTLTFQIGELSNLDIRTFSAVTEGNFTETFTDLLGVASSSRVVGNNDLELANTGGVYETNGFAYLGPIAPTPLQKWETIRVASDLPLDTTYRVQLFTGAGIGPYTLIPDVALTGNSSGFTDSLVDISELDPTAYPSVYVGVFLETADTSATPEIEEVLVFYRQAETDLAGAAAAVRGEKTIGLDGSALPIYKFTNTVTTDSIGEARLLDLEFDAYTFDYSGDSYDIASACPAHPFVHQAGVDGTLELTLVTDTAHTLRVVVEDALGRPVPGARVEVTRTGFTDDSETNNCGQAFFSTGIGEFDDYVVRVIALDHMTEVVDPVNVSGDTVMSVKITES